jgi:dihydrodipicolinate synthase/N-acetylneuraminate lyase
VEEPEPLRLLSNEEFALLSREEKIAYFTKAIEAVTHNAPVLAVLRPPPDDAES